MSFLKEYTLLGELGTGGFAKVYKVRHNALGYIRAIRVLNETVTDENSRTYQKFLRECKVLLRLGNGSHRNIVHIYQPRLLENHALVEMDYVDGQDITHYLKENGNFLPVAEVLRMAKEISGALAYCHEDIYKFCMDPDEDNLESDPVDGSKWIVDEDTKNRLIEKYKVIHNDVHSGNIMRREDGSFVLLDFGLAITGDDDVRNSSRHENGAIEFKAPEKWDDEAVLTEQSDIYSFGIVMYEYLAGRVPFPYDKCNPNKTEAAYNVCNAHKEQTPPPIINLRKANFEAKYPGQHYEKDYPDWLEVAVLRCLEKDPVKRFRNGKELHEFVVENIAVDSQKASIDTNKSVADETKDDIRDDFAQVGDDGPNPKNRKLFWAIAILLAVATSFFAWQHHASNGPKMTKEWVINQVTSYHNDIKEGDYDGIASYFASQVNRYFNQTNITREGVIDNMQKSPYNDKDVEWEYDWNTLNIMDTNEGGKEAVFSYVFHRNSGKGKGVFNITTNMIFNSDGQIVSVYDSKTEKTEIRKTLSDVSSGNANGHDYVDLGLPSGTLWATCNLGADTPQKYGDCFAWGETVKKKYYNWEHYDFNGYADTLTALQINYDAATVNWGNGWHMPTKTQWDELLDNTDKVWTIKNDIKGMLFASKNGQSLFLPAAGYRWGGELNYAGEYGHYWSSSLSSSDPMRAWGLCFYSDECRLHSRYYCSNGFSIRPVREK